MKNIIIGSLLLLLIPVLACVNNSAWVATGTVSNATNTSAAYVCVDWSSAINHGILNSNWYGAGEVLNVTISNYTGTFCYDNIDTENLCMTNTTWNGIREFSLYSVDSSGLTPSSCGFIGEGWGTINGTNYDYRRSIENSTWQGVGSVNGTSSVDGNWIYGTLNGTNEEQTYLYYDSGYSPFAVANETSEYCAWQSRPSYVKDCPNPPSNLVAYWTFDESSGDVIDYINGNNGTLSGNPTRDESGLFNASIHFNGDGNDDIMNVTHDSTIDVGDGDMTILFRFKKIRQWRLMRNGL